MADRLEAPRAGTTTGGAAAAGSPVAGNAAGGPAGGRVGGRTALRVHVFGRLAVVGEGGEIAIRGARRRALCARLAISPGRAVSSDQLVDDVWGWETATASTTLPAQVFRLRRDLGEMADLLVQRDGGYALEIPPEAVDVARFERELMDLPSVLEGEAVRQRLRATLKLWSAPALEEFADLPWAVTEAARIEAIALNAMERCLDLELRLGRHREVLPELEALVEAHPLREHLWVSLMLARYRLGRQTEALDAARRLRQVLREEVGLSPGPAIAEMERRILIHDPTLEIAAQARTHSVLMAIVVRAGSAKERGEAGRMFVEEARLSGGEILDVPAWLGPELAIAVADVDDPAVAATTALQVASRLGDRDVGIALVANERGILSPALEAVVLAAALTGVGCDRAVAAGAGGGGFVEGGSHRLADLAPPVTVRVAEGSTVAGFEAARTNLPVRFQSLVGRDDDLARVVAATVPGRMVTLLGPGGTGKTRLAMHAAALVSLATGGAAWLVDLGEGARGQCASAVARTLGVPTSRRMLEDLAGRLAEMGPVVLVLDGCEADPDGIAEVAEALLARTADLRVLATSREPLRSPAEHVYPVAPLGVPSLPDGGFDAAVIEELRAVSAVRLFEERARAVAPSFALTPTTAPAVIDICRRLDGIPLALELAASRLLDMSVAQLAEEIAEAVGGLRADRRGVPDHQRTLEASLTWGHDRLPEADRQVLEGLAVFVDQFSVDEAAIVLALPAESVRLAVDRLVERGLVVGQTGRLRLLDTVRHHAAARLDASEAGPAVHDRHSAWMASAARAASGRPTEMWEQFASRSADAIAALEWAITAGRGADASVIIRVLERDWSRTARYDYGRGWARAALACPNVEPGDAAMLHAADAHLALMARDWDGALDASRKAMALLGDARTPEWAVVAANAASAQANVGAINEAIELLREAIPILRAEPGRRASLGGSLLDLAIMLHERGDMDEAEACYLEAIAVKREAGDLIGVGQVCANAGTLYTERGDHERAVEILREGLVESERFGDRVASCIGRANVATAIAALGDTDLAWVELTRALDHAVAANEFVEDVLVRLSRAAVQRGDPELALDLLRAGAPRRPLTAEERDLFGQIEAELGPRAAELWPRPARPASEFVARLAQPATKG